MYAGARNVAKTGESRAQSAAKHFVYINHSAMAGVGQMRPFCSNWIRDHHIQQDRSYRVLFAMIYCDDFLLSWNTLVSDFSPGVSGGAAESSSFHN